MVKALFDTNILIDHLNKVAAARNEINRYADRFISTITWIEVLVGATPATEAATRAYLDQFFSVVPLNDAVADRAVALRRQHGLKLPDAVIWASAQVHGLLLVTRNTKDFPASEPGVRIPYRR
jgi:hypothetical protein